MTLCCKSQTGESEENLELRTKHLRGVSGYQTSILAASRLCLTYWAIWQLEMEVVMLVCAWLIRGSELIPEMNCMLDKQ